MSTKKLTINTIFLTQSDQHFLKDFLRDEIAYLEKSLNFWRKEAANLWSKCNPSESSIVSNVAFGCLNFSKKQIKDISRKLKYLRRIQKQVKGSTRDTFDIVETEE